ncbi:hypothetical protein C8Q72DRAFT_948146 [Fomitopsis betulina]|nr:hypothetical protein C8Q72DRAFT_948146 [Fomitopsis betulina]
MTMLSQSRRCHTSTTRAPSSSKAPALNGASPDSTHSFRAGYPSWGRISVMESCGWPAMYAQSPLELAVVMRDAANIKPETYGRGVLHGDIIAETSLIPLDKHSDVLIDFDNAIILDARKDLQHDILTGTLPFMSAELLTGKFYFHVGVKVIPLHDFIHDLESFCWVLVWICLTRDGPARRRPALYSTEQATNAAELCKQVRLLFESEPDMVALAKRDIMWEASGGDFPIVDHVSEFYSPLRRLITDFLKILVEAYHRRPANLALEDTTDKWKEESVMNAEAIYQSVIDKFDQEIKDLNAKDSVMQGHHKKWQEEELARRKADSGAGWDRSPQLTRKPLDPPSSPTPPSPTPPSKRLIQDGPSSSPGGLHTINEIPSKAQGMQGKGKGKASRR